MDLKLQQRWHPPAELAVDTRNDSNDGDTNNDHDRRFNEGDFSDAIDIFSLSESVDFFDRNVDDFDTRESSATQSPSSIIQRYLSDAKALDAASSAVIPTSTNNNYISYIVHVQLGNLTYHLRAVIWTYSFPGG
ncbi:hypothetical protein POM88_040536 [Heracleum sosnowskyi]|uniref:Uncharacterized protein n=1 Tax=Heracleum sosnowskyi TaxID=360622 RepID=A0AAD8HF51_9APIA|nr:hypothetical protein POM88_040536 [Heracleum sosnowskyi]